MKPHEICVDHVVYLLYLAARASERSCSRRVQYPDLMTTRLLLLSILCFCTVQGGFSVVLRSGVGCEAVIEQESLGGTKETNSMIKQSKLG